MISLISFAIAEKRRIFLSTEKRKRSNKMTLEDWCFLLVAYAGEVSSMAFSSQEVVVVVASSNALIV